MIGFKPVKIQCREKVEFYTHVEATMPSHVWWLGYRSFLSMCTKSFLGFLLSAAIVAITVVICYVGIIRVLPMRGSLLVPIRLISIYQPLWLFSQLYLFLPLWHACRFHKAFTLALSSGESCALSNMSVRYVNFWKPKKLNYSQWHDYFEKH